MAPAAATRSKKAATRVTPASKVTKKTSNAANKAPKAPKAKKATKAKTPPPPRRDRRTRNAIEDHYSGRDRRNAPAYWGAQGRPCGIDSPAIQGPRGAKSPPSSRGPGS
ncbi:hypothetical protein HO173_012253 [Letharia columbiana]|uniref:Uncharacterized protein n=1 Tax=Letharia columbiana TaxID=112416 RepID=A0A8H6CQ65_9LECA|nr:uncharacterized protein HO173_012253 [Letharia columbiana]KAF6227513.1 hypothetical protein HO173_012253 [Letharia columbiana]